MFYQLDSYTPDGYGQAGGVMPEWLATVLAVGMFFLIVVALIVWVQHKRPD